MLCVYQFDQEIRTPRSMFVSTCIFRTFHSVFCRNLHVFFMTCFFALCLWRVERTSDDFFLVFELLNILIKESTRKQLSGVVL